MGRPRSDVRERIVAAARARFLAEGVDGASLRDIASDAKTRVGMVAYYFPKKDDLFLETIEAVYAAFLADVAAILLRDQPVRDRLQAVLVRVGTAGAKDLAVVRLIAREALGSSTRRRRVLKRFLRGHVPLLLAAIDEGVRRGEIDAELPPPLMLLAFVGVGAMPQVARRAARSAGPLLDLLPAEDLAAASTDLLFRAIGAPARTRSKRKTKR
jgi:TetR/AcrR family transcriptional regulator, cholesterol catabolism regulator